MATLPFFLHDQNGNSVNDPLGHFKASDLDVEGEPQYFGFLTIDGSWYIQKISSGGATIRYASDRSNYIAAWTNRASLGYDYFDIIF